MWLNQRPKVILQTDYNELLDNDSDSVGMLMKLIMHIGKDNGLQTKTLKPITSVEDIVHILGDEDIMTVKLFIKKLVDKHILFRDELSKQYFISPAIAIKE